MKIRKIVIYLAVSLLFVYFYKTVHLWWFLQSFSFYEIDDKPSSFFNDEIKKKSYLSKKEPNSENLLLFWDLRWGKDSWPPEGHKFGNCTVTYNREVIVSAKAIIFHFSSLVNQDFPWKYPRDTSQIYIWWNAEAPSSVYQELKWMRSPFHLYQENFFNWTMTYKLDSDVWWGYGHCGGDHSYVLFGKDVVKNILSMKTNLAFWITSNCNSSYAVRQRMSYVKDMIAHGVAVTMKGKCFDQPVDGKELSRLGKTHKFYLAFENSLHCRDYITEKFWANSLHHDAVPVVLGPLKKDVLKVAPPNSFIFVEDFKSPQDLAKYLLHLDSNNEEYRKYLQWREDEKVTKQYCIEQMKKHHPQAKLQDPPLTLCEKVLVNNNKKVLPSLHEFIQAGEPPECLNDGKVSD